MNIGQWLRDKFGRIVSGLGFLLQGSDLDISPIKPSLESIFNHRTVEIMVAVLFALSWIRHQYVASQHPGRP